jgi:hypothetical protein
MKKEKFDRKRQAIIDYEEKVLREAQNVIEPMKKPLADIGLKITTQLSWNYFGDEKSFTDRIPFKDLYTCLLNIGICKEQDNSFDIDLEHVCFMFSITQIYRSVWTGVRQFRMYPIIDLLEKVALSYKEVLSKGYDNVVSELREEAIKENERYNRNKHM